MGYSVNPETVNIIKGEVNLDLLERGMPCSWRVSNSPLITKRTAYRIREALYVAAHHKETFPGLAQAAENFSIHIIEDGLIEAKWKTGKTETSVAPTTPTHGAGGEPHGRAVHTVGVESGLDVIAAWRRHLPSSDPLHFTSVKLPFEQMMGLYEWASTNTPRLMLLADEERATLTVSLVDPTVLEFAWTPPKPPEPPPKEEFDI